MKLRTAREKHPRPRAAETVRPAAEQEESSFVPERDIHERDWQMAQILLIQALSKPGSDDLHVERTTHLVNCMELVDPKRAHKLISDADLEAHVSTVKFWDGTYEEQKERAKRKIWANLKIHGIETTPPASLATFETAMDTTFDSLKDVSQHPNWHIDLAKDLRMTLQRFPEKRIDLLERLEQDKGTLWQDLLEVLRTGDFNDYWGAHFSFEFASELCLIYPARAAEVKAIVSPHWPAILNILKSRQRSSNSFELFDPKETLDPKNHKKLKAISNTTNELYDVYFFDLVTVLTILSAEEAEIDAQGRIKLTRRAKRVSGQSKLPDRLVA